MIRFLFLACLITSSLVGQKVTLENCSDNQQFGWAHFTMPKSTHFVDGSTYGPDKWKVVKTNEFGDMAGYAVWCVGVAPKSQMTWSLNNDGEGNSSDIFVPCPWVSNDFINIIPKLVVEIGSDKHTFNNGLIKQLETNAARQVWLVRTQRWRGIQAEWFITLHSYQAQVHLDCTINWTDSSIKEHALENVKSIVVKTKYEFVHWFGRREGIEHGYYDGSWNAIVMRDAQSRGRLGDGEQYRLRGTLHIHEPHNSNPKPGKISEDPLSGIDSDVNYGSIPDYMHQMWDNNLTASRTGPIMAVAHVWSGDWGPTGAIPALAKEAVRYPPTATQQFKSFLNGSGNMWDSRPHAGAKDSGSTGAQAGFGVVKSGRAVTNHEAAFIWQLYYSEGLEHGAGYHYRDSNGERVLKGNHPNWFTWNRYTDGRNSSDTLGKNKSRGWADRAGVSRVTGDDDQHFNTLYNLDLYALTGDYMLLELIRDGIEVDLAQALSEHNPYDPDGVGRAGAARAIGRLLLNWSWQYRLMDGVDKDKTLRNINRRIKNAYAKFNHSSTVKVQDTVTDSRVIPGVEAWMPWQQAICVGGYWAAWRTVGNQDCRYMAMEMSQSMALWTTSKNPKGMFVPFTGIAWNDGDPLSSEVYKSGDKSLLKYNGSWENPSMGWWEWTLQGVIPSMIAGSGQQKMRAQAIYNQQYSSETWKHTEWYTLR